MEHAEAATAGHKPVIGFIGQGYVGKNYADDFERRGFSVVRYALEEPYRANKDRIAECDVVLIAVPTPTTQNGFDASIVEGALKLVGEGKTALIKSTLVPGTTRRLQDSFPKLVVLFSPEFLSEATAAQDATNPFSNVVGMARDDDAHRTAAAFVHEILPRAPFTLTCDSVEAELIKYAHNVNGFFQIILSNLLYDFALSEGVSWEPIQQAIETDPFISNRYAKPVHKTGRGAGGHCFIKDFAAFSDAYAAATGDMKGESVLRALAEKNRALLKESGKDLDLLAGVYGEA
jgi:UDPglucose 6-dehydrogenase